MAVSRIVPTESQRASAQVHLSRRDEWTYFRVDGVRYIRMPNERRTRLYTVRADGRGCACDAYQKYGYSACSHMLAVREAANHDVLAAWTAEQEAAPVAPKPADQPKPKRGYSELFPTCQASGCQDDPEPHEPYCWRHVVVSAF
jgi:hypothetical protein